MYPVCSFCGDRAVVAWFEGPDFRSAVASAEKVRSEEVYLVALGEALAPINIGITNGMRT